MRVKGRNRGRSASRYGVRSRHGRVEVKGESFNWVQEACNIGWPVMVQLGLHDACNRV